MIYTTLRRLAGSVLGHFMLTGLLALGCSVTITAAAPPGRALWRASVVSGSFGTDAVPPPCHPNPRAGRDMIQVARRGDIRSLPEPLKARLVRLAGRPHSHTPTQVFSETEAPSSLFQYYLLDTHDFEPNVFTSVIPGVNDAAEPTATGGDCGIPTVGAVRLVVEPRDGLPADPGDPRAFIDVFTDIDPLFVINNESGWYEGWMIHDVLVAPVAPPRASGQAQFGTILQADADLLLAMGTGNNVPGHLFTTDGNAVRFPAETDDPFSGTQSNVVPIYLSMGTFNSMQQGDVHSYREFNPTTNWVFPTYELPFTGGIDGTFETGQIGARSSLVPSLGPTHTRNDPTAFGDNPTFPRDPDRFAADDPLQAEFRMRSIPSGLANEIYLDVYERLASFEPTITDLRQRIFDAYAAEVPLVLHNTFGVFSAVEGGIDTPSDGFPDNTRLYLPATAFDRFAVTREINDGILAPRFANGQRGWVMTGFVTTVNPTVPASAGRDSDDR